jgi:hypothetical protein
MLPHEKDGAEFYEEERAFLYHDPPMPKAGVQSSEEAVSAEDLSPLPKAPRVDCGTVNKKRNNTRCLWHIQRRQCTRYC